MKARWQIFLAAKIIAYKVLERYVLTSFFSKVGGVEYEVSTELQVLGGNVFFEKRCDFVQRLHDQSRDISMLTSHILAAYPNPIYTTNSILSTDII